MQRASIVVAFSVLLGVLAPSCVDTTPITVEKEKNDASVLGPSADSAAASACNDCVTGDGAPCRAAYDLCVSLPGCSGFADCVFGRGCFSFPLLEDRLACAQPCIDALGLTSTHPALPGVLGLNTCTQDSCRTACVTE